ncbi:TIGR04086 family membrane protein [Wukongibacter sp. M2B1]|uniref:TIGR04086 family membrane protein n=1 Tax=Wukongibacter sp. M2B1 TaxID=3088895 RepID=UPI003D7BDE61
MANAKYYEGKERMPRLIYFRSIGRALIITVILMLIIAAIITYTSVSDSVMPLITSVIMVISIAYSGLLSATKIRKHGLMHGFITGAIYIMLLLFLSWVLARDFSINRFTIIKAIMGVISGGVGGMIGVNLK